MNETPSLCHLVVPSPLRPLPHPFAFFWIRQVTFFSFTIKECSFDTRVAKECDSVASRQYKIVYCTDDTWDVDMKNLVLLTPPVGNLLVKMDEKHTYTYVYIQLNKRLTSTNTHPVKKVVSRISVTVKWTVPCKFLWGVLGCPQPQWT